jgi:hypothetical protein
VQLVHHASSAAIAEIDDSVVSGRRIAIDGYVLSVRGPLLELAQAIGQHWFADPVNPTMMGGH